MLGFGVLSIRHQADHVEPFCVLEASAMHRHMWGIPLCVLTYCTPEQTR